jgi:cellobiose-specific phosphotransferase system component IIC
MALTITLGISYKLSIVYKQKFQLLYSPITNTIISFVCFIGINLIDYNSMAFQFLGVESIAKAILCAVFTTELIVFLYNHKIQPLSFLKYQVDNDTHKALRACLPAILVIFITLIVYDQLLSKNTILSSIIPFIIGDIDQHHGLSLIQSFGLITINQLVWLLGIHPSSLIEINPSLIYSPLKEAIYSRHFF